MAIAEHHENQVQRFLQQCTRCGVCAKMCPILRCTDLKDQSPREVQEAVYRFLKDGTPDPVVRTRAFSCMECFRCTKDICPQGLDPMLINEVIKSRYIERGLEKASIVNPLDAHSPQRILTSVLTEPEEYRRITTADPFRTSRYVFFPGCNVYFQPEKLLNAMDILRELGDDVAFLPGLDHCCGDNHLFMGDIETGGQRGEELVSALAAYSPETVILWCPTCHCNFDRILSTAMELPFRVISFPQYLSENLHRLAMKETTKQTVTLHEACKSAYRGIDLDGPRNLLKKLPGVTLREMPRHGKDTACCGSGASTWFPESCDRIRKERLQEAVATRAEKLVTVCHYCNQTFASEMSQCNFEITNYVNLVAESMGIHREDRFRKYTLLADLDQIVDDAASRIDRSPFDEKRIVEVLRSCFVTA